MKKLIIKAALRILAEWLISKTKNEKLKALYLFLFTATADVAEILTDSDKDDTAQLEVYAEQKLPEAIEIFNSFILEKKATA